jgi:hypothetical protein
LKKRLTKLSILFKLPESVKKLFAFRFPDHWSIDMNRLVLGVLTAIVMFAATQADAATVYFRGSFTNIVGADVLGLSALPNQNFEASVTTNNGGGILGDYIVFAGQSYTFNNGTFGPNAGNNQFAGMSLTNPILGSGGTLTITLPGPVVADSQAGFDMLAQGAAGTAFITVGNTTYIGGINAVPEPSSMLALTGMVVGCGAFARRRRS